MRPILVFIITLSAAAMSQVDPNMPTIIPTFLKVHAFEETTGRLYLAELADRPTDMKEFGRYAETYGYLKTIHVPEEPIYHLQEFHHNEWHMKPPPRIEPMEGSILTVTAITTYEIVGRLWELKGHSESKQILPPDKETVECNEQY